MNLHRDPLLKAKPKAVFDWIVFEPAGDLDVGLEGPHFSIVDIIFNKFWIFPEIQSEVFCYDQKINPTGPIMNHFGVKTYLLQN